MRKNLVVLRAGQRSLHPRWFRGDAEPDWDFALSHFEPLPPEMTAQACLLHDGAGLKFQGLADFFAQHPEVLERYEYIWLPDDDIDTDTASINRMFEMMRAFDILVGQPALSLNSHFSHVITLQRTSVRLRYVTFVEVMIPCLRTDHLRKVLPYFGTSSSGWGLDMIWCQLGGAAPDRFAIFDEIPMHHTRPVGTGASYQRLMAEGRTAELEMTQTLAAAGKAHQPMRCRGVVSASGRRHVSALARRLHLHTPLSELRVLLARYRRRRLRRAARTGAAP